MKLYSPRTWLAVAAGTLILSGIAIVVAMTYLDPPLPSGWEVFDTPEYRMALPPGERLGSDNGRDSSLIILFGPDVGVSLVTFDFRDHPAEEQASAVDDYVRKNVYAFDHVQVQRDDRITFRGMPARELLTVQGNVASKRMVFMGKGKLYVLRADIQPGVFSEADANLFFRWFRVK